MAVIIVSRQSRQHKIAKRAHEARKRREHRAWHMAQAAAMKEQADHMQQWLNQQTDMPSEEHAEYDTQIVNLRALALETENAKCMDDHG
ncbi:hypothetical protein SEA_ALOEVERA_19 [Microbacterium phage AloeVera]|uniref:Uncharacterized protein n=3 Tax=Akonivirus akoni TaxID=2845587 RepID=A0A6M3T002_9CAUD|nr:hypothetical protein HWC17_gp19 [Microbacterium phage Akoni]QCG78305.1 hypothetical protein SEA_AKONI_19 [Microbacterium phage Akoni]QJD51269.1 hypothetical protein SEA_TRUONG_19 [Microbacterium phage Truong]QJD51758.1 hypothetical protein SEA_ASHTON_19 [Microbacterium phage Ashton]